MSKILYEDILNTYNITPSLYFNDFNSKLSEKNLMKMIFSKFSTDSQYNTNTSKYISFILRPSANTTLNIGSIQSNTYYYERNMLKTDKRSEENSAPALNTNIIDFDMTYFASNDIINYCLYLDIIIEVYAAIHDLKTVGGTNGGTTGGTTGIDNLKIKSRYYYDGEFPVLFSESSVGFFEVNIQITRDEKTGEITDVDFVSDKPVKKILDIFRLDIFKHLNYLHGDDIVFTKSDYIEDVVNFYRLCRLKLMYSISHSIYLLTLKDDGDSVETKTELTNKLNDFIREYILAVFINFKTFSTFNISSNGEEVYSNEVISKANKLRKVNESISRGKAKLKRNKSSHKNAKEIMKKKYYINIAANAMIILVILISLVILFSNMEGSTKSMLSVFMIIVTIVSYVILMLVSDYIDPLTSVENFVSGNMVSLPQFPLTKNKMVHHDGNNLYFFRVEASSSLGEEDASVSTHHPYLAFDDKPSTSWKSDNASTYVNGRANYTNVHSTLKGEYLMIDLCQYVDVESMTLSFTEADCGPKSFTLLYDKDDSLWDQKTNNSFELNNNDEYYEYSYFIHNSEVPSVKNLKIGYKDKQFFGANNEELNVDDIIEIKNVTFVDYSTITGTKIGDRVEKIILEISYPFTKLSDYKYYIGHSRRRDNNQFHRGLDTDGSNLYIHEFKYKYKLKNSPLLKVNNASYDNTMTKTFDIPQNDFSKGCRYFLLIIHELTGNGDHAEITSLKFNVKKGLNTDGETKFKHYVFDNNGNVDVPRNIMARSYKQDFLFLGNPGKPNTGTYIFEIDGDIAYAAQYVSPRTVKGACREVCGYWSGIDCITTCDADYVIPGHYKRGGQASFGNGTLTVSFNGKNLISESFRGNMNYVQMMKYKTDNYDNIDVNTITSLPHSAIYSKIIPINLAIRSYDLSNDTMVSIKFTINAQNFDYKAVLIVYFSGDYNVNVVNFDDIKKTIEKEIISNNITPVDSAEYLANILKQEQKRLADIQKKIDELNQSFTTESGNLQGQIDARREEIAAGDEGYTQQLLESQRALQEATVTEAQRKSDLANAEAATAIQKGLADAEDAYIVSAQQRRENLQQSRREYMDSFQEFMTASQTAEYASVRLEDSNAAYDIALAAANKGETDAQARLALESSEYLKRSAEIAAEKAMLEQETARKIAEFNRIKYSNQLRDDQIATLREANEGEFSQLVQTYQSNYDQALIAAEAAKENRIETENNAALYLQQLNANYDMSTNTLAEANYELKLKKAREEELIRQLEADAAELKLEEERQKTIFRNSEMITAVINGQIEDIDQNIEEVEGLIEVQLARISTLESEKEDLNNQFQNLLVESGSSALIESADRRNAEKLLKVNELKIEKASLLAELLQRDRELQQGERQTRTELLNKDNLEKLLQDQFDITDQYRDNIAYNKNLLQDYNVYNITKDIDAQILQSLNKNINGINNELVLGKLNKEYDNFNRYEQAMKLYVHQTEADTEINKLDRKSMDAGTQFLIHLSIIISIFVFINNQFNLNAALIIAFVLFIIATVVYYARMIQRVRTRASNYYWNDISKENSNNL